MPDGPVINAAIIDNNPLGKGVERMRRIQECLELFPRADVQVSTFRHEVLPLDRIRSGGLDCLVLSGSGLYMSSPSDRELFEPEMELVRGITIPVLGICFGHQLMAHAFGAVIRKNDGTSEYNDRGGVEKDLTFIGEGDELVGSGDSHVNLSHWDYARPDDERYLEQFKVLATTTDGKISYVQYARHRERLLFGVQFHPECADVSSPAAKRTGLRILHNFMRIVKREVDKKKK